MPNTSKIPGLRPIDNPYGNVRVHYYKAVTNLNIFLYDIASQNDAGVVGVGQVGSGSALLGSVVSILNGEWSPITDLQNYYAANGDIVDTDGYIRVGVADDPNQYFVVEEDTGGSALAQTNVGNGCDMTYIGTTGNTASGLSTVVLDRSTASTTSNAQLKLIKLWDKPDNAFGDFAKWIVKINYHQNNPSNAFPSGGGGLV